MRRDLWLIRWSLAIALCSLAVSIPVAAQITTGTVSGSVKDAQGGVVPGATVVVVSESRGTRSVAAVTNETGDYVLPNITPDTYTVEVSMQGFKTLKRTGVAVSGGDRVAVGAVVIEVGGAAETVDVTAEAPLIQASSGERSFTVTYGWVQNQLGSMIITPVSNRFNAGLGDLPLLFPDAGVVDSRYYELKPLEASATPYFQDGRILLPPTFAWGNRVANAPPNLGFPGFMNINRTQDFSISLTKVWERHTIKAGYLNHSYQAQNLGAGGGASFQGNISFANDTANPLDTGFGFANAALGVFTNYQQQSKFVEGSFIYNQVDWFQDNWKVNSKLTLDYGLRFVNQQPQYDQYLQSSNFFPERWSQSAAPALYVPGCVGASPCTGTNRQARNPQTGQLLGPNTALAIGQLVPNTGDALNGIVKAGDGIAKGNYEWPTIAVAPDVGAAYEITGSQRLVLRGGFGLFFDRPNGNSVFSQVGNPPFSTATTVRYSQLQSLTGGLTTQGPPFLVVFKYDSKLPSSYQWNGGIQFSLPWSLSGDVSYVGQHGFNLPASARPRVRRTCDPCRRRSGSSSSEAAPQTVEAPPR